MLSSDVPRSPEAPSERNYWAFISYNHRDDAWGRWLLQKVETYRTPRRLVGRDSRNGPIPRRLHPVYRDREELPVSADLGGNIKKCLERSRYLIVICSPEAAKSAWVTEEVRYFKQLGRQDCIMALIVRGEPNAADKPHLGLEECFPETLRHPVLPNGALSPERVEPIAADARPHKDGRGNALLKIIAGILGVNYDDLKRRERRRRIEGWCWRIAAAVVLLALGVAGWRVQQRLSRIQECLQQGQQELRERGNLLRALPWLAEAWRLGSREPALPGMIEECGRALVPEPTVIGQHTNWVSSVIASTDGRRLLTASFDRTAVLWDFAKSPPVEISRFTGHRGKLAYAAFNADASRVVTAGWDGVARVWDSTGKMIAPLLEHRGRVNTAFFGPAEPGLILTASDDGTARIWGANGALLRALEGHEDFVKSAVFNHDGSRVVTASLDGTARIWSVADGVSMLSIEAHKKGVNWAAFSPDGRSIVTAGLDGAAKVWDAVSGALLGSMERHRGRLNTAAFSPNGRRILTAGDDGDVILWDAETRKPLVIIECERLIGAGKPAADGRAKVLAAAFSPDGAHVLTACDDNTARIWAAEAPALRFDQIVRAAAESAPWMLSGSSLQRRR